MGDKTKLVISFIAGFITCFCLYFVLFMWLADHEGEWQQEGIELFEGARDPLRGTTFTVVETFGDGNAFARSDDAADGDRGMAVVFPATDNTSYTVGQKIEVPEGFVAVVIGVYTREAEGGGYEAYPVVGYAEESYMKQVSVE